MKRIQPAKSNALQFPGASGYGLRHFDACPHQSHEALKSLDARAIWILCDLEVQILRANPLQSPALGGFEERHYRLGFDPGAWQRQIVERAAQGARVEVDTHESRFTDILT